MSGNLQVVASDLRGLSRLAVDATIGVTDLVEAMHHNVRHPADTRRLERSEEHGVIEGMVYGTIRLLTRAVGSGVEALLSIVGAALPDGGPALSYRHEALRAALNGVVGDHLAATGNPLAIVMSLHHEGRPLVLEKSALATTIPKPGSRLLLLIHGLCRNDQQWTQNGRDPVNDLARDLNCTPLYLRYNSGLHVSTNGRALADLLESLLTEWPEPVESLTILSHSMGGLVARSACRQAQEAGQAWPASLRHLVFLGTPHHGSPLERWGHWVDRILEAVPFAGPLARLGKVRSAGITDLRHGNLLDGDWQPPAGLKAGKDRRTHVPLPEGVHCFALAAVTGTHPGSLKGRLLGDGLVPLDSALGRHRDPRRCLDFPENQTWVGHGMGHLDLITRPEGYEQIRRWLRDDPSVRRPCSQPDQRLRGSGSSAPPGASAG